jgi:lipoprotein-releasing system permease protein
VGATLIGVDPAAVSLISRLPAQIQQGSLDTLSAGIGTGGEGSPECAGKPAVLLGREMTNHLGCLYGDPVRVVSPVGIETPFGMLPAQKRYCVGGIFQSGLYEYDSSYAYVTLGEAQKFLQMGTRVSGIDVGIKDLYQARTLAAQIRERLGGGYRVEDWMQKNRRLLSAMRLEKITAFSVLTLIVLVAVLSILSSLSMTVIEKKKEIAVLKALGATRSSIQYLFVLQGMSIGVIGTLAGVVAGIAVCKLLETYPVVSLPQDVFYQLTLPVRLHATDVLSVSLATLLLSLFATLYPAWRAARVPPAETMRYT